MSLSNPESLVDSLTLKTLKQRVLRYTSLHPDRHMSKSSIKKHNALQYPPIANPQNKIPQALRLVGQ